MFGWTAKRKSQGGFRCWPAPISLNHCERENMIIGMIRSATSLSVKSQSIRPHRSTFVSFPSVIGIAAPVLVFLDEDSRNRWGMPLSCFLAKEELSVFEDGMAQLEHNCDKGIIENYRLYGRVLGEQGIDITRVFSIVSRLSSDQEGIEHFRQLNLVIEEHDNCTPTLRSPVRLPWQKGILRKPKTIQPVNMIWP